MGVQRNQSAQPQERNFLVYSSGKGGGGAVKPLWKSEEKKGKRGCSKTGKREEGRRRRGRG